MRDDADQAGYIIHKKERFETSAWRHFVLPRDVDLAGVTGRLVHGELHLTLMKSGGGGATGATHTIRVPVTEAAA